MQLKDKTVDLNGARWQMLKAMAEAERLYEELFRTGKIPLKLLRYPFTITSALDGKHMEGSLHSKGFAFDMRTWVFKPDYLDVEKYYADQLRTCLGRDYDVVIESNHIHVEYDPKAPLHG